MVQEFTFGTQAGDFAAVAEARVYGHSAFLAHGGAEQQLAQIVSENRYAFQIGLALGFAYHFGTDRRLDESLEGVFDCHL